jgi:hypothetical protein
VNDELQRRINEHVLNGDAPSIIWAMEGQIRINTKLEAKLAELERRGALLTAFVEAWETERRATTGAVILTAYNTMLGCHAALVDAGFPWTEEPQP